jgi:hypothetical protein
MGVSLYDHLIIPPVVPFAGGEGRNVRGRGLPLVLEVVGPQMA